MIRFRGHLPKGGYDVPHGKGKPGRRARRRFRDEFKAGAVRLVLEEGKTVGAVARELDLTASALGLWVKQAQAEQTQGKSGLLKEERAELVRLRKALRIVEEERDILESHGFFEKTSPDDGGLGTRAHPIERESASPTGTLLALLTPSREPK